MAGVVWRVGGATDAAVQSGHWLCMSYEHSAPLSFKNRQWHFKDSMGKAVQTTTSANAMSRIAQADAAGCDWFIVVDCQ